MLIAVRMKDNDSRAKICYSMEEAHTFLFNPLSYDECYYIPFKASGKTYKEKKESVREQAKEYQYIFSFLDMSWSESDVFYSWFEKMGARYGLIKEFRENAII